MKILLVGAELLHANGQTDGHDEVTISKICVLLGFYAASNVNKSKTS